MCGNISTPDLKGNHPRRRRRAGNRVARAVRNLEVSPCFVVLGMMYAKDHWATVGSAGSCRAEAKDQPAPAGDPRR